MINIKKTILVKKMRDHYIGELTKTLDEHSNATTDIYYNYVYGELAPNAYVFRMPGSTTGKIIVDDNNIIQQITIYNDTEKYYYKDTAQESIQEYIGQKLIILEQNIEHI